MSRTYLEVMAEFDVPETVARAYVGLGPLIALDDDHDNAVLWLLCAMFCEHEQMLELFVRDRNDRSGWGNTIDVDEAPDEALEWLAQFVGVILEPNNGRVAVRDQIKSHAGFNRGTVPTIVESVKDFLVEPKRCGIIERATVAGTTITADRPWRYTVVIHEDDLSSYTYAELALALPTYADVAAEFPTYADMESVLPAAEAIVQSTKPGGDLAYTLAVDDADYTILEPSFTPIP